VVSAEEYQAACERFREHFGNELAERAARRLDSEFFDAVKMKPNQLFEVMMRIIRMQYVLPLNMMPEIDRIKYFPRNKACTE
jgi:hypothetical protein